MDDASEPVRSRDCRGGVRLQWRKGCRQLIRPSPGAAAFGVDSRGRLVGRIAQVATTIQPAELVYYILLLARECDQFEFALVGVDKS